MSRSISLFVSIVLLAVIADRARAQTPAPSAVKTIGTCVAIQTSVTTAVAPIDLRAEGSCQTVDADGRKTCTATIVPTGADLILDVTDQGVTQCLALAGVAPCAVVENGPVIFQSQKHATQSFSTNESPVRMTTMIRQKKVQQTAADLPPTARFPLNAGRLFDVLKNRHSVAARLECAMADGDQMIFPIVGEADLSPNIHFVSKNSSEPTFDILTYRVAP
jgi:hypothetical protein